MEPLRAADKPHTGQPVAPLVERGVCSRQNIGMSGEAEVVVGAHVEHTAASHLDVGPLGRLQDPLGLVRAGFSHFRRLLGEGVPNLFAAHASLQERITLPLSPDCMAAKPFS